MSPKKPIHAALVAACALALAPVAGAQDLGDFAMSLAMPDPAAPAAPARLAQAAEPQADVPPSSARSPHASTAATSRKLPASDRRFLEAAAKGGMAEVALGKLAQERGASGQVKQFGSRMVEDHGKANDELKRLAQAKDVALPSDLDGSDARTLDRLKMLSGPDFDRAYMKLMVTDHKKDVAEFRSKAGAAGDADVKSFAQATLPTLREHLDLAQSVEAQTRSTHANRARNNAAREQSLPPPPSTKA